MDIASLIGVLSGIALIVSAILLQGNLQDFVNAPGLMIVLGGTLSATLLTFKLTDVIAAFKSVILVFLNKQHDPNDLIADLTKLSRIANSRGLAALERVNKEKQSLFMRKALTLISDNAEEQMIYSTLRIEIQSLKIRNHIIQDIFQKMGLYAPAFGMIGTLIGLVEMLSRLDNPANIGPAMAIALITTFYGTILSTMFFLPMAGKLRANTIDQVTNLEIVFEGALSILRNENPLVLYDRVISFIPPNRRREYRPPTDDAD